MQKISEIIATVFYIGKIKYAPGTFGSLPAFLICYVIKHFAFDNQEVFNIDILSFYQQQLLSVFAIEISVLVAIFLIGTYCTHVYIKDKDNKDPKEVVIDEVVGQMLTIILVYFPSMLLFFSPFGLLMSPSYFDLLFLFILPFGLFRLYDIKKPWPICWVDQKCKGALGVMIDDVIAGIFAAVTQSVIILLILDFYAK
ncbi:MAG: hypothetical protein DGJ47_000240 [Rickettsiaceae bacterium]